ncbi:MAG TPA: YceI family protein [Ktedonobacteraceae bacterium]|jgi:polyisoprenoid-binding protein YceI|nr:YceI family protein [Ktedonobacteraceae bacterium]
MRKRFIWLGGIALVILIVVAAGMVYAAHFASTVNQSHTPPGAIKVTPTSIPTNTPGLRTFQIVSAQSTASYSVYENLIFENKPNNDAIGRTHSVQGTFQIRTSPSPLIAALNVKVDLRTLQSDSDRRDHYIQMNTLQTDTYPYATFVSVSAQGLPSSYTDGQTIHFQLIGNLTLHGTTNKETFDVQGKVSGNTVTGTATSTIYMTDFGMQPPNLANIAIAQNKVVITLDFTATQV